MFQIPTKIHSFLTQCDWKNRDVLTGLFLWLIVAGLFVMLVHVIAAAF